MRNHILNTEIRYVKDQNNHLVKDQKGLFRPAKFWDPSRHLFPDEKIYDYNETMDLWESLWQVKGYRGMRRLMAGKTEQLVGTKVSLNGYPKYDPELFKNQTIIKDGKKSRPFYVKEVSLL